ncbi:hypothetical protein GPJ56_009123 [Histomonas meleagridis]|uniref:uncharacterized protein n=1 Tax=Histomonas meleagridis TaxID=135588 RepID=UPI0035595220|nr:hypothetical protein GPJ56_009123 [Histomonas meleagridis]KAH0799220.1 hypothetical protein GO595_008017 [Histomonas meleagridis]
MQIFIRIGSEIAHVLSVDEKSTVFDLKCILQENYNYLISRQQLIFRGIILENDEHLKTYGISEGTILYLFVKGSMNRSKSCLTVDFEFRRTIPKGFGSIDNIRTFQANTGVSLEVLRSRDISFDKIELNSKKFHKAMMQTQKRNQSIQDNCPNCPSIRQVNSVFHTVIPPPANEPSTDPLPFTDSHTYTFRSFDSTPQPSRLGSSAGSTS